MKTITDLDMEVIHERFKTIFSYEDEIEKKKEDIKVDNKSIKGIFKELAEAWEASPKVFELAYKDWVFRTSQPDTASDVDTLSAMIGDSIKLLEAKEETRLED